MYIYTKHFTFSVALNLPGKPPVLSTTTFTWILYQNLEKYSRTTTYYRQRLMYCRGSMLSILTLHDHPFNTIYSTFQD